MGGWIVLGIFVVLIAFTVLIWVAVFRMARRRRRDLAAWATEHGWSFEAKDTLGLLDRFDGIPPANDTRTGTVSNVLRGTHRGRSMTIFDYQITSTVGGQPGGASVRMFTGCAAELGVAVPELSLSREGLGDRLLARFGRHDVAIGTEDFDAAFRITCDDPRFAADLLTPTVQQLLLQRPRRWTRVTHGHLLTVGDPPARVADLQPTLDWLAQILDEVPEPMLQRWAVPEP